MRGRPQSRRLLAMYSSASMSGSFVILIAAGCILAAILWERARGYLKERRLEDHRFLNADELAQLFSIEGMSKDEVLSFLKVVSSETSIRRSLLRPHHRIQHELAPVLGLSYDDLSKELRSIIRDRYGIKESDELETASTLRDLQQCIATSRRTLR